MSRDCAPIRLWGRVDGIGALADSRHPEPSRGPDTVDRRASPIEAQTRKLRGEGGRDDA
jgi:hypothetical protein